MFKGYNLKLSKQEKQSFLNVSDSEINAFEETIKNLKYSIRENINKETELPRTSDNKIDGSKLINDWFPNYKADVFISHSHNDARTAKRLACWLKSNFNLTTFIDSIIWGSADELLMDIDKEYSVLRKEKNGNITYDYKTRNYTTSHVHMMLATALDDIINSTECIIFLNTPESLVVNEVKQQKTNSPWIYNELKIASIVEKKNPRQKFLKDVFEKRLTDFNESRRNLEILYPVGKQLAIFENLGTFQLEQWLDNYNESSRKYHPLDILYFNDKF